jgi:hypothetical protein
MRQIMQLYAGIHSKVIDCNMVNRVSDSKHPYEIYVIQVKPAAVWLKSDHNGKFLLQDSKFRNSYEYAVLFRDPRLYCPQVCSTNE